MAQSKSYIRTVINPADKTERLRFLACEAKTDWSFYVQRQKVTKDKTETLARGASQRYATFAEAQAAVDAGVTAAQTKGWKATEAKPRGFKAAADAFTMDALPEPAPAELEVAPAENTSDQTPAAPEAPAETPAPEAPAEAAAPAAPKKSKK